MWHVEHGQSVIGSTREKSSTSYTGFIINLYVVIFDIKFCYVNNYTVMYLYNCYVIIRTNNTTKFHLNN